LDIHKDGSAKVVMTLTAPGCPVAGEMPVMVADALDTVPGIGEIEVTLTFDPPWTPEMMSEDARLALGF
jgi:metal-sulfur cluster biosynthetic enzyme